MTAQRESIRRHNVTPRESICDRILVGVDATKESLDACRQAGRLAEPQASIEAATVSLFPPEAPDGDELEARDERTAATALTAAAQILGPRAELRRLHGLTVDALLDEIERTQATLLAIGTQEHRRIEEIVLGGVAGELLHKAPCAVLVARPAPDLESFPREIVVGVDGSGEAEYAFDVARGLAMRRHSSLRSVVALGGKRVDLGRVASLHPWVEASSAAAVKALVEASACADLLVVGSRGLHGPRALGSVSERVAHQAGCSVLVVR
jgi:nucleotide-binding universal stress UspA family protein